MVKGLAVPNADQRPLTIFIFKIIRRGGTTRRGFPIPANIKTNEKRRVKIDFESAPDEEG